MRHSGGDVRPARHGTTSGIDSWWDNPGRPTPYLLWGLLWCRCGTTMVPLDWCEGTTTERFCRCDAGCGRSPIPAGHLEHEIFGTVVERALDHLPRYTLRRLPMLRIVRGYAGPDRRRDLIRRWVDRIIIGGCGQPPQLHWLAGTPVTL